MSLERTVRHVSPHCLRTPVVLIVDCTKASSTVAAVVLGCRDYDPEVEIGGVILNNVSPGRHETVIRKAIEQSSGIPVVGAVPRQRKGEFPERHMGLTPFQEHPDVEQAIQASAAVAERYLDLGTLWDIASSITGDRCSGRSFTLPEATGRLISRSSGSFGILLFSSTTLIIWKRSSSKVPGFSSDQRIDRCGHFPISTPSILAADFPRRRPQSWQRTKVSAGR